MINGLGVIVDLSFESMGLIAILVGVVAIILGISVFATGQTFVECKTERRHFLLSVLIGTSPTVLGIALLSLGIAII